MENPATWSDDAKAIDAALRKYEGQVAQGVIGHSLVRVIEDEVVVELRERIEMLNHIALSAIALKLNIENGFPPSLHALNRDLGLFQVRFGGVVEMIGKAAVAMDEQGDVAQVVEPSTDNREVGSSSDPVTTTKLGTRPCRWCDEGYLPVRSSVSEAWVHPDSPVGRAVCPNRPRSLIEENDKLRKIIAESESDCIYCGLKKADMAKCAHGFPGCGRADDLMA